MQIVHFTPREIAALLRVNESTVKRWIDRGMLPAIKTAGGHRRITQEDLAAFSKKHSRNTAHSYVLRRSDSRRSTYSWKEYYSAIYHEAYAEGLRDLTSVKLAGMSITELFETIMVPALIHIGEQWGTGKISISDEHRMTLMIREHVTLLLQIIPEVPRAAPTAVLACVPGENHELILHMIRGILQSVGIRAVNLGINVPLSELVNTVKEQNARIVCITRGYEKSTGTAQYVRAAAQALPESTIYFGGRGWSAQDIDTIQKGMKNTRHMQKLIDIESAVGPPTNRTKRKK